MNVPQPENGGKFTFSQRQELLMGVASSKNPEGKPVIVQNRTVRLEEKIYINRKNLKETVQRNFGIPEAS